MVNQSACTFCLVFSLLPEVTIGLVEGGTVIVIKRGGILSVYVRELLEKRDLTVVEPEVKLFF